MTRAELDKLDRMDLIASCWRAVSSLIQPDSELDRDNLALLIEFLVDEYEIAINQMGKM
jgi:hypothetical protein